MGVIPKATLQPLCELCVNGTTPHLHTEPEPHPLWLIPSSSVPGEWYECWVWPDAFYCSCPWGQNELSGVQCWHAQMVSIFQALLQEAGPDNPQAAFRYLECAQGVPQAQLDTLQRERSKYVDETNFKAWKRLDRVIAKWFMAVFPPKEDDGAHTEERRAA